MQVFRVILCLFVFTSVFSTGPLSADQTWKFGKSKVVITPPSYMWMSGYGGRNKPADGKLTDLWCKVLVLEDRAGTKSVLITLDLIGIGRKMSQEICERIEKKFDLLRSQIAIATSHTHTGPALDDNLMPLHYLVVDKDQQKLIESYSKWLKDKICDAVELAASKLMPASLSWGSGKATFAVNRRNNPEAQVPKLRAENKLQGPFDHDVPVLAVRQNGKLSVVVFGYACHATVLSFYKWSGDYPGFAQLELEKMHPDCQAMFWAGCGADQNPLPRRKVELAKEYGLRLAQAVHKVLTSPMKPVLPQQVCKYREIELPLSEIPSKQAIEKDSRSSNKFVRARAKFLLSQMKNGEQLAKTYPYPVQSWQLGGEIDFVFLGGEVVVDFAIRLKSELRKQKTWVAGYSNDVMAYIASRRVLREGGYEGAGAMVYYGLPCPWAMESENLIVDQVLKQLRKSN